MGKAAKKRSWVRRGLFNDVIITRVGRSMSAAELTQMIGPDAAKSQQYPPQKQGGDYLPNISNIAILERK
jgi:hypothetical protein